MESEHRRFGTACLLMALLVACGGGDGDEGLASSCSPSPSINSEPSESASVEEQYRYHVQATVACITFFTPCGVELLEGPPDSGIDPIRVAVYWTPGPEDANRSFRFSVATVRDPCGQRAVQTWNVFVAPTPEQAAAAPGVGPAVVRTIPESGTVSVPLSYEVVADFSEEIAPATLTPASFVVTDAGTGAALAGTIAYASRRAVFTPAGGLPGSATITARVRATVTDLEGNPLAADYAWSFQTSPAPDTTPPMVVAVSPPEGSSCAPVDGLVTATFDEKVRADSVLFDLRDPSSTPLAGVFYSLYAGSPSATLLAFGPNDRLAHGATYRATVRSAGVTDESGNRMTADRSWTFTTVPQNAGTGTWSRFSSVGAPPGLSNHNAVWTGAEIIVWGYNFHGPAGGRYHPATDTWRPMSAAGAPSPRAYPAVAWTGSEMFVWGGHEYGSSSKFRNDGALYNPETDTWRSVVAAGAPAGARFATAVWTGTEVIVFGGNNAGAINSHNGRYNPATNAWRPVSSAGAPNVQYFHSALWTGERMLVWGGSVGFSCGAFSGCSGKGAGYDPVTDRWTPIADAGAPSARSNHSVVWTGSRMIVWGGGGPTGPVNTGGIYDPQADTWQPTSIACGVPSERAGHLAAWSGSEMLVWSGNNNRSTLSGARYDPASNAWQAMSLANAPATSDYESMFWTGSSLHLWRIGYWDSPSGYVYHP